MQKRAIDTYLSDSAYSTPGSSRGLIDVFTHRYLLRLLADKGVATRYYGSVLGWVWSYIRPATQFLMYYLVIGLIMGVHRGIDYFPIYLFTGIVTVNLYNEILRNTTSSILDNRSLVRKIYLPRELFAVAACQVALVHFMPQVLLLFVVVLLSGWTFSFAAVLSFIGGVLLVVSFTLGMGLFFGAINALYRDAKNIVELIMMFATWASPVLYSFGMVKKTAPEWLYNIYMSNPITVAVELFHNAFWLPLAPNAERPENMPIYILVAAAASIVALALGQISFRKLEASFAQRL